MRIEKVAKKHKIKVRDLKLCGTGVAKVLNIDNYISNGKQGHLVLVSAVSPDLSGEGKTTISIGLCDGLNIIKKNASLSLREPSLGPVFGQKGGATGGGKAVVVPEEEINLHFTGDFHALTAANNLISASIDNHIYWGNELKIKEIIFNRCLDVCDRSLKSVQIINTKEGKGRTEKFNITAASEMMSILTLSENLDDLKNNVESIIIALNEESKPVYVKDLKIQNAVCRLLTEAIKPNIAQTAEGSLAVIHSGPFANISVGTSSIIATRLSLAVSDYAIVECGFGADLGAEKFFNIICQRFKIAPSVVVLVCTVKALKYNGTGETDMQRLETGVVNLKRHISNVKSFGVNVIVALNKFATDSEEEINFIESVCDKEDAEFCTSTAFLEGGAGSVELAKKVVKRCEKKEIKFVYSETDDIKTKIEKVAKSIYGAKEVKFEDLARTQLKQIKDLNLSRLPVCIAKTQYSFSDDKSLLGAPSGFVFKITSLEVKAGAGFIVALAGDMMLMPGMGKINGANKN